MKYVIFKDDSEIAQPFLGPDHFGHDGIASLLHGLNLVPISAGELRITIGGDVQTFGFSTSLSNAYNRKIESDPGDSAIIHSLLTNWFHCLFFDGLTPFLLVTSVDLSKTAQATIRANNRKLISAGIYELDLRNRLLCLIKPLDIPGAAKPKSWDITMLQKTIFAS